MPDVRSTKPPAKSRRSSGEGSIGQRKDGLYYGAIRLDGQRHYVYGETRKEVADKLKVLREKHEQGVKLDIGKLTVEAFLERWLEEVVKRKNKYKTYHTYSQCVRNYIIPALGRIVLTALRPDHVQTFVNDLAGSGKAPNTVRNTRAVLRRALNQAMSWRYVTFNAAALVETPRVEPTTIQPLTRDEAKHLLDNLKGHRLEALYLLCLLLGLREGEVLGLLITNLDLDAGKLRVEGTLHWQEGKLVRDTAKTKASIRTLPLPASLVVLLREHLCRQQEQFPDNEYVFASVVGTPLNPRNIVRQFKGLLRKAGLRQELRFHDLRHSAATFLIARGEHPRTVMEILGHAQISTTMQVYGHVLQETKVAAIAGVEVFLTGE